MIADQKNEHFAGAHFFEHVLGSVEGGSFIGANLHHPDNFFITRSVIIGDTVITIFFSKILNKKLTKFLSSWRSITFMIPRGVYLHS